MSSGSVRLHVPVDLHQHGEPAGGGMPALPAARDGDEGEAKPSGGVGRLWRESGKVLYQDGAMAEPVAARVVWARPLSGRGGAVSVLLAGKKRELAFIADIGDLALESREVAEEELCRGRVLPRITAVYSVFPRFGNYYWDVETDLGRRTFLLASPETNTQRPMADVVVIRDVAGNCYEIRPVSGLDRVSRREMERVL